MKTVILPGFSPQNKLWAYEVKGKLDLGHDVFVHEWGHWSDGSFSHKNEIDLVLALIDGQEFNILAKSVGTRITMEIVKRVGNLVNKVILCGIPTKFGNQEVSLLYREGLNKLDSSKIICIQNSHDPFASYEVVSGFVRSVNQQIQVIEKSRSDHEYPYFDDFQKFLAT